MAGHGGHRRRCARGISRSRPSILIKLPDPKLRVGGDDTCWPGDHVWRYGSPFVLDVRAVGIFRILLGLTILVDQFARLANWHAFHSEAGLVSLADSRDWHGPWHWSLYWLSEGPLLPVALEGVRFVATVTLAVGVRSRLSAFVLFLVLSSLAVRNPLIVHGGDRVLIVMAFFAVFLRRPDRGRSEARREAEAAVARPSRTCRATKATGRVAGRAAVLGGRALLELTKVSLEIAAYAVGAGAGLQTLRTTRAARAGLGAKVAAQRRGPVTARGSWAERGAREFISRQTAPPRERSRARSRSRNAEWEMGR